MNTTIGINVGDKVIASDLTDKSGIREVTVIVLDIFNDNSLFAMNKYGAMTLYNIGQIKGIIGSSDIDDEIRSIISKLNTW